MFYSFLDYLFKFGSLDTRRYEIINHIENFFSPMACDSYYIMDPYLDIVKSIQNPFTEDKIEDDNWSFLMLLLAKQNAHFKIITRESLLGIINLKDDPPFFIPIGNYINGATVSVCQYVDTKYFNLTIHDRYILKKNGHASRGLHMGPSFADIHNKDVALTIFSQATVEIVIKYFDLLWEECIKNKGWTKG
jgi:hypothetical protein